MTKTIFVVEAGEYSDRHIVGVYSTAEKATVIANVFSGDVEEWPIDHAVEEIRRGCRPYGVRLHRETGDVLACNRETSDYYLRDGESITVDVNDNLFTAVVAESDAEAVKIASERRRVFLANEQP